MAQSPSTRSPRALETKTSLVCAWESEMGLLMDSMESPMGLHEQVIPAGLWAGCRMRKQQPVPAGSHSSGVGFPREPFLRSHFPRKGSGRQRRKPGGEPPAAAEAQPR